MTKETAFFAFRRDNETVSCRGEDLKFTATQDDYFFLWRGGTVYKTRLAINPDKIESIVTEQVDLNYEGYAFVRNRDTGARLAETSPPFADAQQEKRVYENIFDGDPDTQFKSYTNSGIRHDVVIQFPEPIDVYGSITIRAGFHTNKRLGEMLINGVVVRELEAWDDDPQDFTANYTGQINEFSIRQKELNGQQCTAVITYIDIDGERLVSNVNTSKIVMAVGTDMTKYKINMRIKKYNGTVIGKIGAVEENTRTIWLTEVQPFQAGDGIIIEQVVDDMIELSEVQSTDWFACTEQHSPTNHISYKVDGNRFVELFQEESANFEVTSGNVYLNMRFGNTSARVKVVRQEDRREWAYSGSYTNHSLPVGNYMVPTLEGSGLACISLEGTNGNGNFKFKSNFDMSTVQNMRRFVKNCTLFDCDISHFDLSNVTNAYEAFFNCRNFNSSVGGGFDMPKVSNVSNIFRDCVKFNQPINEFNFSNVDRVENSFRNCNSLNQDISGIKWKSGAWLNQAFWNCQAMNHPGLAERFPFPSDVNLYCSTEAWKGFGQSISNWTQPLPTYCRGLFSNWSQFNQNVGVLDTSNVENFEGAFRNAIVFNHPGIQNIDTSNMRTISNMFFGAKNFDIDLNGWDVSNVRSMDKLFWTARKVGTSNGGYYNLESWDTSNVSNLNGTFASTNMVKGVSTWNTSNVYNMAQTFSGGIVSDDLSGWDVSKVNSMWSMFRYWGDRVSDKVALDGSNVFCVNFEDWNPKNVTNLSEIFSSAKLSQPAYLHGWRVPNVDVMNSQNMYLDEKGDDKNRRYHPMIFTGISKGLRPIEPGVYEPDLTLVGGQRVRSGDSTGGQQGPTVVEFVNFGSIRVGGESTYSNSGFACFNLYWYHTVDLFYNSNMSMIPRMQARWKSYNNATHQGWSIAPRRGYNNHLLNRPPRMFKVDGKGADRFGFDMANQNSFNFKDLDTSNWESTSQMFENWPNRNGSTRKMLLDIETWDVSNVSNMNHMFTGDGTAQEVARKLETGDLRGWCVQNVRRKPTGWNSLVPEKDPCWGECPLPGEIGECGDGATAGKPMPDGPWKTEDQQYYISIDERAAGRNDRWYIALDTTCQLWRASRGTQSFRKQSNANYFYLDLSYDWIVSSRYSGDRITFVTTEGPLKFLGADTTNVTNMSNMFKESRYFNDDIGWWDTGNVQNMRNMFYNAKGFSQDLSGWDVSRVSCSRDYDKNTYAWVSAYKPNL